MDLWRWAPVPSDLPISAGSSTSNNVLSDRQELAVTKYFFTIFNLHFSENNFVFFISFFLFYYPKHIKMFHVFKTKRERLKSALYLRFKNRKVFKIVKGGPSGFLKVQFAAKYQKIEGGPFGDEKYSEKIAQCRKKVPSGTH